MRRVKVRRSYAIRVGAWFVGIFAVALIASFAVMYLKVRVDLEDGQRRNVIRNRAELLRALPKDDFVALKDLITKKVSVSGDDDAIFLLTDVNGQFAAGNIAAIPRFSGWRFVPWTEVRDHIKSTEEDEGFLGLWSDVSGGHLLVGNSDGDVVEARETLLESLIVALVVALVVAGSGGFLLARHTRRHLAIFSDALDKVAGGNLAVRVPTRGRRDELDHIASRMNWALERLQVSVESLRQATTDIAHDLKSPISRMRLRLQNALALPRPAVEYQELIGNTLIEIDKIADTFDSLLSISQIEAGSKKQSFASHSLASILSTVNDAFGVVAEDAHHHLKLDIGRVAGIEISCDKELLTQLFANLIENAIRHCPPGAQITLAGEPAPSGAVVSVGDNGPGIPESEQKNVFRRLYRLEKSRTTPGNGLGLALVSAIAELHGASVTMSDNCPGLRVEVHFPAFSRPTYAARAE